MKIYTKTIFDMATLEILEVESIEYSGEVALCSSGGGGDQGNPTDEE